MWAYLGRSPQARASSPSGAGNVPKWCGLCPQVVRAMSPSGAGIVPKWRGHRPQVVRAMSPGGAGIIPTWCGLCPQVARAMSLSGAGYVPKWRGHCPQVARALSPTAGKVPKRGQCPQLRSLIALSVGRGLRALVSGGSRAVGHDCKVASVRSVIATRLVHRARVCIPIAHWGPAPDLLVLALAG